MSSARLGLILLLVAAGCDSDPSDVDAGSDAGARSTDAGVGVQWSGTEHWLCHPDLAPEEDHCRSGLDTTVVAADGTTTLVPHELAVDPTFDCFYVYPTASVDSRGNSDLEPGAEEIFMVRTQAARFSSVCRVFAPVYRQVTLNALLFGTRSDRELAYADVLAAFEEYMSSHNDGRGVLLIGHSQGSGHLRRLIAEELEADPEQHARLVAAYLLGTVVEVPLGADVGGSFASTPLCRADDQVGCVIAYASYRATNPPTDTARYGGTEDPSTTAACVNPAALAGGPAPLRGYTPTELAGAFAVGQDPPTPYADPAAHPPVATPFFATPGLTSGECVERDGRRVLEITVSGDPADPRADDIGRDFREGWGLHLVDVDLTQGDLIELAQTQAAAWASGP